jgi:hypothetical protein
MSFTNLLDIKYFQIWKLENDPKKYIALFFDKDFKIMKKTKFGASGYQDFTMHKNKERRRLYRLRHANDNLSDFKSPGSLSYYILWGNSANILENIRDYANRFNLRYFV